MRSVKNLRSRHKPHQALLRLHEEWRELDSGKSWYVEKIEYPDRVNTRYRFTGVRVHLSTGRKNTQEKPRVVSYQTLRNSFRRADKWLKMHEENRRILSEMIASDQANASELSQNLTA